jgi:DNA-binding transcriptional ArsR family regulator
MKLVVAIQSLGALAHERRLEIFRLLIKQGPAGLPAGVIGSRIGLTPSSLTFHLQALQRAGLVAQTRSGRQLFYSADFAAMNDLVGYLTDECCIESAACPPDCAPARKTKSRKAA